MRHALQDHRVSSQTIVEKISERAQVVPGDIAGDSTCSLGPAFKENGPFAWCVPVFIGAGAAGFGEFFGGVFSPASSSSTIGGQ